MYGLVRNTDSTFIVGQSLMQACFGANDLILHFEETEKVMITITSGICCISPDGSGGGPTQDFGSQASFVLSLLGIPIGSASVLGKGTLQIEFETDAQLQILDDSEQFESYTIKHRGNIIVV
jgi:hypothetical protein